MARKALKPARVRKSPAKPLTKVTRTKAPKPPKVEQFEITVNTTGHRAEYSYVYHVEDLTAAAAAYRALGHFISKHPKVIVVDIEINDEPDTELLFLPYIPPAAAPEIPAEIPG